MICSDIWHKYLEWYFKIVIRKWNLRQFWNITSGIYAKYHVQIMLLFVYTTTLKKFVIFTCRHFKLSWNTTALSQSNCRHFSCSSITDLVLLPIKKKNWLQAKQNRSKPSLKKEMFTDSSGKMFYFSHNPFRYDTTSPHACILLYSLQCCQDFHAINVGNPLSKLVI